MKLLIDTDSKTLNIETEEGRRGIDLYSNEAFALISRQWLKVGWNRKLTYTYTWLGRPIIQLPEDLIRLQEGIYRLKPDVIIETGIAHGGSLVYGASLCKAIGKGRVIGIDVEIRPHNRRALEEHGLYPYLTLIEGNSTDPGVVARVKSSLKAGDDTRLVILDSCHTRSHVLGELEAYHAFVSKGSYIIVEDGIMEALADVPKGNPDWKDNNPKAAAMQFLLEHPEFVMERPKRLFDESELPDNEDTTYWPSAWLKRR